MSSQIPVDEALLAQARNVLGTTSTRDTLELALSLAIRHQNREQAVESELARFGSGHYDVLRRDRASARGGPVSPSRPPGPLPPPGPVTTAGPAITAPPSRGWLLDTSALAVAAEPAVTAALGALLHAAVLHTCPILDLEALGITASGSGDGQLAAARRLIYSSVPLTPAIGARAQELLSVLARRAHLGRATPVELLVAATALEHGLSVLHYSVGFELLGQLCGLDQHPVAPLGSLP